MQTNLKTLSSDQLIQSLKNLVNQERTLLTQILWHLKEVDERKLFLEQGYPSLFEYCVAVLAYSESQAYRRIAAMRLLREIPALESKLDSGQLKLTQVTLAQEYFRHERKQSAAVAAAPLTLPQKVEILNQIASKSARETERYFAQLAPEFSSREKTRQITPHQVEIKFVISEQVVEKLTRFKELDANGQTAINYAEVFERLLDLALKQKEKSRQNLKDETPVTTNNATADGAKVTTNATADGAKNPRFIPAHLKRQVLARDQGKCVFKNSITGKVCGSRFAVQLDHLVPVALGGQSTLENLRCLCRAHNQFEAQRIFGAEKIRAAIGAVGGHRTQTY